MTNIDLGGCEQFIYELRRSSLIDRGQLDQVLEDFLRRAPGSDPRSLAAHLVSQNVLTRFQADRVLQGKTQGLVLGPYVLTDAIGQGSMGIVHKAVSKTDGKTYAVKVLPRRSMWNVRLARRQVRAFGQFSHPTVVAFVDVGTSGGLHYLVWNFVDGETLDAVVQRHGRLDPTSAAQLGLQVAAGLNIAHQNGLFHGLLKPSNLMLSAGPQVRILDFGIGSLLAENEGESLVDTMSTANTLTSGLDCTSPESIMEPTNRTPAGDQYSLGCVLYFCLTGQYPFPDGSAVEKMMAHQFKQPRPITELAPEVPAEFVAVIDRLLQKKPEDRFVGMDEVVESLQDLAAGRTPSQAVSEPIPEENPAAEEAAVAEVEIPIPSAVPVNLPTPRPPMRAVPAPAAPAMTPMNLPTRRSLRGEAATPAATPATRNPSPPPAPAPLRPRPQPQPPAQPPVARLAPETFGYPPEQGNVVPVSQLLQPSEGVQQLALGPVGFLALGAAVAVACFLIVTNIMK